MAVFNFTSPTNLITGNEFAVQGQFSFTASPFGVPVISPTVNAIANNTVLSVSGVQHPGRSFAQTPPITWVVLTTGPVRPSSGLVYPRNVK